MRFRFSAYYHKIFQAFLLLIYTGFFSVQLFYNFDNTLNGTSLKKVDIVSLNKNTSFKRECALSQKHHTDLKTNIRLNKRFQPKSIIDCSFPVFDPIVKYTTTVSICKHYDKASFLNYFLLTRSLRGPPAVA